MCDEKDNNKLFFSQANSLLLKQLCSHTDKEKEQGTVAWGKGRTPAFLVLLAYVDLQKL